MSNLNKGRPRKDSASSKGESDATSSSPEAAGLGESGWIVGIGASAGGLKAFSELLRNLPADTGMAFVLVQQLDPHHESVLAELLGHCTAMPAGDSRDFCKNPSPCLD